MPSRKTKILGVARSKSTIRPKRKPEPVRKQNSKSKPDPKSADDLISMQDAIDILKTTRPTFYRWLRSGKIKGMKVGRQWRFYREDIEKFLKGEAPRIDLPADIKPLLNDLKDQAGKLGIRKKFAADIPELDRAVSLMLAIGVMNKASDIHICPNMTYDSKAVAVTLRYRIDGILHQALEFDSRLLPGIIEQWKRMANADVNEKLKPQEGRIITEIDDPESETGERVVDIRVCFVPTGLGESLTARILDSSRLVMDLDKIDFTPEVREKLLRHVKAPWGLILFTGPTGSGKTTVMYCCINQLACPELKVMSIEDPIEYYLPWVTQMMVNEPQGITFKSMFKAIMRSDPDVIMIGEIRDLETLNNAMQGALTGHLVMTQLHVNEAARALTRMMDIGADPFVVADATRMIVAQRLVRLLCKECSVKDKPPRENLEWAKETANSGGLNWKSLPKNFRKPKGCKKCNGIGFKGRNIVVELLEVTPEIGKAVRERAGIDELTEIAIGQGMITIAADAVRRAANGETSLDETMRVVARRET